MSKLLLQVKDLGVRYHTNDGVLSAVRNTTFNVSRGEIVGIVGESGCGKSTLASSVMRLLAPNGEIFSGQILVNGLDICKLDETDLRKLRGNEIAMIFQDAMTSLNPVFSIEQQMIYALRAHQKFFNNDQKVELKKRALEMLDRVGIPEPAKQIKQYPHQFSGGMRQRIMIATALLSNPSLLVADEPTSALDVTLEAQILNLIKGLRSDLGTGILYITHDLGVIANICDRMIVMYTGNIVESGDVYSVFQNPRHPYTYALLHSKPSIHTQEVRLHTIQGRVPSLKDLPRGCKFAPRCPMAEDICHIEEPRNYCLHNQTVACHAYGANWKGNSLGKDVGQSIKKPIRPKGKKSKAKCDQKIVIIKSLSTYFKDHDDLFSQILAQKGTIVRAVDGVDLELCQGEVLGLVGESGSGKTTLGRTLLRLIDPTDGKIILENQEVTKYPQNKMRPLRARMQMIFQDPYSNLSPRMKVSSLLLEPYKIHNVPYDKKRTIADLLELVGLSTEQADKYPHQLSGGQARRVGIARALALKPDILVADEPTAGLDVSVAAGVLNLLQDLREEFNLTIIVITHNLNTLGFIADRVAVMYLGRIVEIANTDDVFNSPKHPYTEALISAIPIPDPQFRDKESQILLSGEIPSPRNPPSGCPFHPRCRYAERKCEEEIPALSAFNNHFTSCFFPEKIDM